MKVQEDGRGKRGDMGMTMEIAGWTKDRGILIIGETTTREVTAGEMTTGMAGIELQIEGWRMKAITTTKEQEGKDMMICQPAGSKVNTEELLK